jgi:hypothetical protein
MSQGTTGSLHQQRVAAAQASKGTSSGAILGAVRRVMAADRSCDCLVSTEVSEHLENLRAVFREFYRLPKRPELSRKAVSSGLLRGRLFSDTVLLYAQKPAGP